MTQAAAFRLETLAGDIAVLTFDQPGSRANTLGQAVQGELEKLLDQLEARTDLGGLIFQSAKPGMFIAGADLREMGNAPRDPALVRHVVERGLKLNARFEALPFPTVATINGACVG